MTDRMRSLRQFSRSRLARSLSFSLLAKFFGSFTVVLALPLIAGRLGAGSYSIFLQGMSAWALVGLLYSPLNTASSSEISWNIGRLDLNDLLPGSLRPYVLLSLSMLVLWSILFLVNYIYHIAYNYLVLCILLSILQYFTSWAEVWRLAFRRDYITSLFQSASSITLVALLYFLRPTDLFIVGGIFFGIPLFFSLISFFGALRKASYLRIAFRPGALSLNLKANWPIFTLSIIDYGRIYGTGFLVFIVGSKFEYAKFFSLILLAARFVNPISMITKPLLPAYISAINRSDENFMRIARSSIAFFGISVVVFISIFGLLGTRFSFYSFSVSGIGVVTSGDLLVTLIYFVSYAISSAVAPFYVGLRKSFIFGLANFLSVATGLLLGGLLGLKFGGGAVLYAVAVSTLISSLYLIFGLSFNHQRFVMSVSNSP